MKKLKQLMKEIPVSPSTIVFEVTETMALHDPAQMRDIGEIHGFVNELRSLGFRFALDDFGTGFTSFRYLKVLDVDIVKIDGEYIKGILQDADDKLFVASMVQLCKGLGIETIAEFVENGDIMTLLTELGVGYGQGWHLGKPQPDLPRLVAEYNGKVAADYVEAAKLVGAPIGLPGNGVAGLPVVNGKGYANGEKPGEKTGGKKSGKPVSRKPGNPAKPASAQK
jgi:EAL domain-containing protein (putative c-di-GMP-specific phosphodiesterase class I)